MATHTTPGGQGPWFVALLFNTSDDCKKQTHLVAHTHPHMAMDILNKPVTSDRKKKERDENYWIIMMKVGPFDDWTKCVEYLHLWSNKIRGPMRRLERGLEIFSKYRLQLNLTMWAQHETKTKMMAHKKAAKRARLNPMLKQQQMKLKERPKQEPVPIELIDKIFQRREDNESTIAQLKQLQLKRAKVKE